MSDDIPSSLAEAMAEIRRLRARVVELEAMDAALRKSWLCRGEQLFEVLGQREKLERRVVELEAAQAMVHGTLERATTLGPVIITHNIQPNAPPHGEPEIGHE